MAESQGRASVFKTLCNMGILPVIRCKKNRDAFKAVEALVEGGIPIAEITMTIPKALELIETLKDQHGDTLTVGVGTVTDADTCAQAIEAGSQFVVTPIYDSKIISICCRSNICIIGGALTPTEIFDTYKAGADAVKVFPASALGGPNYFRLLKDPLPEISLVPTGGVTIETAIEYFNAGAAFVGAGTDLISKEALEKGEMDTITKKAEKYVEAIRQYRFSVASA